MESSLQMFEREAQGFLEAHAKPLPPSDVVWGQSSDKVTTGEQLLSGAQERDRLETAKAWRALEYDNGFGWITGPASYGGRELPAEYERCYRDVRAGFDVAAAAPFTISLGMVGPTIPAHGAECGAGGVRPSPLPGRDDWMPAVQRTGGGIRPGRRFCQGGARWRRVGRERAEGGRPAPSIPRSVRFSVARTQAPRSTKASPCSLSTCGPPVSRYARYGGERAI